MKKNKKYWKKEAKGWKKVARIESEEANNWAELALDNQNALDAAMDQIKMLNEKLDAFTKRPTETIKPGTYYNIPCPPIWQVQYPPTPPSIATTGTSYKEMNITPKKCNCNCNCKNKT